MTKWWLREKDTSLSHDWGIALDAGLEAWYTAVRISQKLTSLEPRLTAATGQADA